MKKLTIEQKAQRYDEALKVAKDIRNGEATYIPNGTPVIETIFPELAESEDESIRNGLIGYFRAGKCENISSYHGISTNDILAWLEKQGEQKPTDKVEPKFKNGQWIVWQNKCYKVNYNGCGYELIDQNGLSTSLEYVTVDENAHLWTIKDAKPGDILFHSDSASNGIFIFKELLKYEFSEKVICYCDYDSEDHFCLGEHHTCCWADAKILQPATKEQRDQLEKAMNDAGYTFDFEKKELKKIEQKPAWSEEDEGYFNSIAHALSVFLIDPSFDEINLGHTAWFKSLKDRYTWKPTEEQLTQLKTAVSKGTAGYFNNNVLRELYVQLKQL